MPTAFDPQRYVVYAAADACDAVANYVGINDSVAVVESHTFTDDSLSGIAWILGQVDASYDQQPILQRGLAFDKAVQHMHNQFDLVPMRFHEPLGLAQLQLWHRAQAQSIRKALDRLRGTTQLNVRWLFEPSAPVETHLTYSERCLLSAPSAKAGSDSDHLTGGAYLRARHRATQPARTLEEALTTLSRRLELHLPGSRAIRTAKPRLLTHELLGTSQSFQLAGIECLVERVQHVAAQRYLRECKLLGQTPALVTDALPAFAFVDEESCFTENARRTKTDMQVQSSAKESAASTSFLS